MRFETKNYNIDVRPRKPLCFIVSVGLVSAGVDLAVRGNFVMGVASILAALPFIIWGVKDV